MDRVGQDSIFFFKKFSSKIEHVWTEKARGLKISYFGLLNFQNFFRGEGFFGNLVNVDVGGRGEVTYQLTIIKILRGGRGLKAISVGI